MNEGHKIHWFWWITATENFDHDAGCIVIIISSKPSMSDTIYLIIWSCCISRAIDCSGSYSSILERRSSISIIVNWQKNHQRNVVTHTHTHTTVWVCDVRVWFSHSQHNCIVCWVLEPSRCGIIGQSTTAIQGGRTVWVSSPLIVQRPPVFASFIHSFRYFLFTSHINVHPLYFLDAKLADRKKKKQKSDCIKDWTAVVECWQCERIWSCYITTTQYEWS